MLRGMKTAAALALAAVLAPPTAGAEVQLRELRSMNAGVALEDVCVAPDGSTIYALTRSRTVLILNADGSRRDTLTLDEPADRLTVSPRGDVLILTSRETGRVRIVQLDFVYRIDAGNSPFKGPKDAPVVITVFSDFQ